MQARSPLKRGIALWTRVDGARTAARAWRPPRRLELRPLLRRQRLGPAGAASRPADGNADRWRRGARGHRWRFHRRGYHGADRCSGMRIQRRRGQPSAAIDPACLADGLMRWFIAIRKADSRAATPDVHASEAKGRGVLMGVSEIGAHTVAVHWLTPASVNARRIASRGGCTRPRCRSRFPRTQSPDRTWSCPRPWPGT